MVYLREGEKNMDEIWNVNDLSTESFRRFRQRLTPVPGRGGGVGGRLVFRGDL